MKKIILFIIVFISTLHGNKVLAQEPFIITDFSVKVTVKENNTYDIYEKASVNFLQPSPRYKRVISLKTHKEKASLELFECLNTEFELKKNPDKVTAIFGENDILVAGERNYSYLYTLSMGADPYVDKDRFYLNLVPDESYGKVLNAKIQITLPKYFNSNYLSVNLGGQGDPVYIPALIEGNTITVEVTEEQLAGRELNILLDLPEGYFIQTKKNTNVFESLTIIANITVIILLLFSCLVCFIFDNNSIQQHREDPDALMSEPPCEAAYVLDGEVILQDVFANIIHWANKGKVEFHLLDRANKRESIRIVKKDEMDVDAKSYEKSLYNEIFSEKEYVSIGGLHRILKRKKSKIDEDIYQFYSQPRECMFPPKITLLREMIRFTASIPFIYITFKTFYVYTGQSGISLTLALFCSLFFFMLSQSINAIVRKIKSHRLKNLTSGHWLQMTLGVCMFVFFLLLVYNNDSLYMTEYFSMMLSGILITVFSSLMVRRTEKGKKAYEDIIAFKNYLLNVYDDNIQENSNIIKNFFEFLPYTVVTADMENLFKRLYGRKLNIPAWMNRQDQTVVDRQVHVDQVKEWMDTICNILNRD